MPPGLSAGVSSWTGGHLPVELSLGQGGDFKVREPSLKDPRGASSLFRTSVKRNQLQGLEKARMRVKGGGRKDRVGAGTGRWPGYRSAKP